MSQREDLKNLKSRIEDLQRERLYIQKKTFTKWVNSFLVKARMEVVDLFTDLKDGKNLLKLLEIISGEKLGKPNNGKLRVHYIENVNKSLAFLHTKVRLESIGAEDIVDGNPRLILGLIWTIILRFQIQEIEIAEDEDSESSEKRSAKDALLLWCQRKTTGYRGVHITDFTTSWRSGLGFNALIHAHRPDLINFDSLNPSNHIENLNNAFDIAYRELGITRLLDAEDIDVHRPDEKSVMTYVASYYHTFAKMKTGMKGGRRIANIVQQMMDADHEKFSYESFTSNLLDWINEKIASLEDRNFPNSLEGIQIEMSKFKKYRTEEKPPKYAERSDIEAMLFSIQMKLKSLGQPLYNPPEGKLVHDIERAWEHLEKAEHLREVALREALLEQEKLQMLAYKFERKSVLREGYLREMIQVLSDPRYGSNIAQVEATVKKHEAISADILARKDRFSDLANMAEVLEKANYHDKDRLNKRKEDVLEKWNNLLELLEKHRVNLHTHSKLMGLIRDIDAVMNEVKAVEKSIMSENIGKHLFAIEDLVQKLAVMNSQIAVLGESVTRLNREGNQYIETGHKDAHILQKRLEVMNEEFNKLSKLSKDHQKNLEETQEFLQFMNDAEEEEAWVNEKQHICMTIVSGKDLRAVLNLQQKHKALEAEIKARWPKSEQLFISGEAFSKKHHSKAPDVHARIEVLKKKWQRLHELSAMRRKQLEDAAEAYQFYADANEAESWMKEKLPVVSSEDYGKDEPSAQSQLQRLYHLEGELKAYSEDVKRLNEQADKLISAGITSLNLTEKAPVALQEEVEEYVTEIQLVPTEIEVEEIVYKEVLKNVTEERRVPQVQALYNFSGQGIEMSKGEKMTLLHKTNDDWWNIRKMDGREGFVPATYVKEIEPKTFPKIVQKRVKVPETRKVKKIVTKKQEVRRKKEKSPRLTAKSLKPVQQQQEETETVDERRKKINDEYRNLIKLAEGRRQYLIDAIRLFGFYFECDDFEGWMKEKEKMLISDDRSESVEVLKRKFESFLTDLLASRSRLEDIDLMVVEFERAKHSQLNAVCARQKQIKARWARLEHLTKEKEKSLEGASSVEMFNRQCDEACDWMLEKMNKMDTDDLGKDLKTVQALQRKHQNIERELAPVEDKVNRIYLLANSVKNSYPNEQDNIDRRQKELQHLWQEVQKKAKERRKRLEGAVGAQIFTNGARNLLSWVNDVKQALNNNEAAKDVATAEKLIKNHEDLGVDIRAHQDEFKELQKLGETLLQLNPESNDIKEKLLLLNEERHALDRGWKEKARWLQSCKDLQVFNREADQMDATTSSHNTFLEYGEVGQNVDDVDALLKRHDEFESTLVAQDDRLNDFYDLADKLIGAGHYDSENINDRRDQVMQRRLAVKEKAQERKLMLLDAKAYGEFVANADELKSWMQEKYKTASDESYRDLANLERKLKKHEAFERELKANEGRLRKINFTGTQLIAEGHYRSDSIQSILDDLNNFWNDLQSVTADKGKKLRDAASLRSYNRTIEEAHAKLSEMNGVLQSDDVGSDLRTVKYLLEKHGALEGDLANMQNKTEDLVLLGHGMAKEGHFDAQNILAHTSDLQDKYAQLKDPSAQRRQRLEEALKLYQFIFEVDSEKQWIKEHVPSASSKEFGQSLLEAQNLDKKHFKLERELVGHTPVIDKIVAQSKALIALKHFASPLIEENCQSLLEAWKDLHDLAKERRGNIELSLRAQQFFHDANEVEAWMNEKSDMLNNQDYGRDEDAVVKLLTKHKALELEIDTYSGLVSEIANQGQQMIDSMHPDSKMIQNRQQLIVQQMRNLQKSAGTRRLKLMKSRQRHEYFRESAELEQWINEQMQIAQSEEYGKDFEHLILLQAKFDDFSHHVEANKERFIQCENLAKKLLQSDSPVADEVQQRQEQLASSWKQLLEQISMREQKLHAAGEIHRFNRDVSEALSRIQEKYAAIPEDLGRDLNSVLSLIRRHEGFENDLVALEAQLQILVDDSARLQAAYPGQNAEHILEQQMIVLENWNTLSERATHRKRELQASCDLHRFLASVRDLTNWASGLRVAIMTEDKVRDAASAQQLKAEHDRLKSEIEAREESFRAVVQAGQMMIQDKHYASEEINDKLDQLLDVRQNLHADWQHKKVFLEQLIDLQFFLRDAKQIDTISGSQEVYLSGLITGETVEEIIAQVKKHDEFEKLVLAQDEKLVALQDHGTKLISQEHFGTEDIRGRMEEVKARRGRVKELCHLKKQHLADALLYAKFSRDVAEAESWLEEKRKKLTAENLTSDVVSLEDKIKKLQKHQAFQAELAANQGQLMKVKEKGEMLLKKQHENSPNIKRQIDTLVHLWQELVHETENRGRGLEEAQDILDFNNQVQKVETWIRDKEMMIQARDAGRDYEHCCALQRKLDDVDSDMRVDDSRMRKINALADKLIRQGRSDTRAVQQRREELNQKWRDLQGALDEYREFLAGALEIHAFNRDCDDINERINEKSIALSVDDCGKDLDSVEALQRKLETLERELTTIDQKIREQDAEAKRLMQKFPDKAALIRKKFSEVTDNWRNLIAKCTSRKQLLASSYTLQKFNSEMQELESWVEGMISRMKEGQLAKDIAEAERLLHLHQERKAEIDGRQENFKTLKEFGHRLVQQNHYAKNEIENQLGYLEELRRTLTQAWEERKQMLSHCLDLQKFYSQAGFANDWLSSKEAFLNNEDLGDSMASVEALIRKHDMFEKTVKAQSDIIEHLEKFATELMAEKHYASAEIQTRLQAVCQRRDHLKENAMIRSKKLKESKQLQQFLRNIYEVMGWIQEKLQVAIDESYRDPTNLQSKIQKHQAFEAELTANEGRVDAVVSEGENLIGAGHFAGMEVQARLDELQVCWRQLVDASQLKKERLHDAYQALLFTRNLEELEEWMDEVENQLQSEDHGSDMTSVQKLLKKHQLLEGDIHAHAENIEQIKDMAANFANNDHFMREEIQERADAVVEHYASLHEPVQIRRENLEDALLLYQFLRDVDDEMSWILDKQRLAFSVDLGNSLSSVQNLQKKHQALEVEIQTHEPLVTAVINKAQQMLRSNHFASSAIEKAMQSLSSELQQLKDQASVRRLRLADAIESQMFYSEAGEAKAWIEDKTHILSSFEFGKDRDSVQSLIKKHEALQRDIGAFGALVAKLHQTCHRLIDRGHFDASTIEKTQAEIEVLYKELQSAAEVRMRRLIDNKKLYKFLNEASDVGEWIHEQNTISASEEYGKDVEHVEILIQKFENFLSNLNASENRVKKVCKSAEMLVKEGHPEPEKIQYKADEIVQLWDDLKETAQQRQEALAGAKQIHIFDRKADEAISWMQEKDAALSNEDFGPDLESIQTLILKHEGFQRDLAALKEQVEQVINEAKRLIEIFPDAGDHINVKHEEIIYVWNLLLDKSADRKEKLQKAENLQAYFDDYRELMAWLNEMMAKITAPDLAQDVPSAEALISRHKEIRAEIDTRSDAFDAFKHRGKKFISEGHFMAGEIQEKVQRLESGHETLLQTWMKRNDLYRLNLSIQIFKRDADQLDSWLQLREPILRDGPLGSSINEVEDLIRKHEDFEKTILAQEEKFAALKKMTLLEEAFRRQKKDEEEQRKFDVQRKEQERLESMKRKEQQRIMEERRRENEHRKLSKDESMALPLNGELNLPVVTSEVNYQQGHFAESGASTPRLNRSRRSSLEIPDNLKFSLAKDNEYGTNLRRVESLRMDVLLKKSDSGLSVKRAESMKDGRGKQRTPSFTTRKRASSRPRQSMEDIRQFLPKIEMSGILERKQELQSGGKRATFRSWKSFYTVLCGQLMCFFKEEHDLVDNKAANPPFNIHQAKCVAAPDYTKKKHVFRLHLQDGAEYLFATDKADVLSDWVKKIDFHAQLPPSQQLMSYDEWTIHSALEAEVRRRPRPNSTSSSDSYASASEDKDNVSRHPRGGSLRRHAERAVSDGHVYTNVESSATASGDKVKPPVPPRSSSIGSSSGGNDDYSPTYQITSSRRSVPQDDVVEYQNSLALLQQESKVRTSDYHPSSQSKYSVDTQSQQQSYLHSHHLEPSEHLDGNPNYVHQRQPGNLPSPTEVRQLHHSLPPNAQLMDTTDAGVHLRQHSSTWDSRSGKAASSDGSHEESSSPGTVKKKKKWWQRRK